jgi:hypothetical protein
MNKRNKDKPKCSKCQVNDAIKDGITLKIGKETITLYNQPVCQPCINELLKCQKCKTNEMSIEASQSDGSKIYVCQECDTKLKKIQTLRNQLSQYLEIDNVKLKDNLSLGQLKQVEQILKSNLVQEKGSLVASAELNEALLSSSKKQGRLATCYLTEIQQKIKDLEGASKKEEQKEPKPNPGREPKPNPPAETKPNPSNDKEREREREREQNQGLL